MIPVNNGLSVRIIITMKMIGGNLNRGGQQISLHVHNVTPQHIVCLVLFRLFVRAVSIVCMCAKLRCVNIMVCTTVAQFLNKTVSMTMIVTVIMIVWL